MSSFVQFACRYTMVQLLQVAVTHSAINAWIKPFYLMRVLFIYYNLACPVCRTKIRGEEFVVSLSLEKIIIMYLIEILLLGH